MSKTFYELSENERAKLESVGKENREVLYVDGWKADTEDDCYASLIYRIKGSNSFEDFLFEQANRIIPQVEDGDLQKLGEFLAYFRVLQYIRNKNE